MKGVCYRMEDHDYTKRFKNKMRMVIEATKIQFEKSKEERQVDTAVGRHGAVKYFEFPGGLVPS